MKAVVYKGPNEVAVNDVDDPRIEAPTDAIVKITSTAICGSDLHMYEGRTLAQPGMVFGHEPMGVVDKVGDAVMSIKPGDRVVMPFNIACGFCFNCERGYFNACLTVNPEAAGGGYGYVGMGPYKGGQAEYLRVPFADVNCTTLPGVPGDEFEDDFVLLADIFPTGYHSAELADVKAGDTVAVFGAGPVGLMSAYSSILRGASEVYVVDQSPARLSKAEEIGAIPIDFTDEDPVEQIRQIRSVDGGTTGTSRPGEDKMLGVMCGIDAVGYEALNIDDPSRQKPNQVIQDLARLVNPTGHIGLIGVYFSGDPGGMDDAAKQGDFMIPLGELWSKGITVGMGQAPVKRYQAFLRDLIITGRAKPSFLVSQRLPLGKAPEAYQQFEKRDEWTKVILKPDMPMAA